MFINRHRSLELWLVERGTTLGSVHIEQSHQLLNLIGTPISQIYLLGGVLGAIIEPLHFGACGHLKFPIIVMNNAVLSR